MQLSDGTNSIDDRRFDIVAERLEEDQFYEYEAVHDGSGRSEEMPSQLERRHKKEWRSLQDKRRLLSVAQWVKLYPYSI